MNSFITIGRFVDDPELKTSQSGNNYTKFRIAVQRKFKREGEPDADFFNCTAFGKTAEFITKYFTKGNKVALTGELRNNNYTDKDGNKVYGMTYEVNVAEFVESKASSEASAPKEHQAQKSNSASASKPTDDFMNIPDTDFEELPFN